MLILIAFLARLRFELAPIQSKSTAWYSAIGLKRNRENLPVASVRAGACGSGEYTIRVTFSLLKMQHGVMKMSPRAGVSCLAANLEAHA